MGRAVMRSRILLPVLLVFLVTLAPAEAATFAVSITKSGFSPSGLTIAVGDTVVWTNSDTTGHQIESKSAGFTSPLLAPGQTFSFTYTAAGRYAYQDKVVKKLRGTVTVQGATGPPISITGTASRGVVVHRDPFRDGIEQARWRDDHRLCSAVRPAGIGSGRGCDQRDRRALELPRQTQAADRLRGPLEARCNDRDELAGHGEGEAAGRVPGEVGARTRRHVLHEGARDPFVCRQGPHLPAPKRLRPVGDPEEGDARNGLGCHVQGEAPARALARADVHARPPSGPRLPGRDQPNARLEALKIGHGADLSL
jgi:plastocyanin